MKTIIILSLFLFLIGSKSYRKHFKNLKVERHSIDIIQRLSDSDTKLNRSIRKHLNLLKFRKKKNGLNFNNCLLELVDSSIHDNQCIVNYKVSSDFDNNNQTCNQVIDLIDQQEQHSVKMGIFMTKLCNLNDKHFFISVDQYKQFTATISADPIDCPDFLQFIKQSYDFKYDFNFKKDNQKDNKQSKNEKDK